MRLVTLLILVVVFLTQARAASDLDSQYRAFYQLVAEEIALPEFKVAIVERFSDRTYEHSAALIIATLERRPISTDNVISAVRTITLVRPSARITEAGDKLIAEITRISNIQQSAESAQLEALRVKARDACLSAQKASDLDATIASFMPYQKALAADNSLIATEIIHRGVGMMTFVKDWQTYLNSRSIGDTENGNNALRRILASADPALFPRSKILMLPLIREATPARVDGSSAASDKVNITPPPSAAANMSTSELRNIPPEKAVARIEPVTLDQLEAVVNLLAPYFSANQNDRQLVEINQRLLKCLERKKALEKGHVSIPLFTSQEPLLSSLANTYYTEKLAVAFDRLDGELRRLTLRTVFKDSGIDPVVDEGMDTYIFRVAQAAVAVENWEYALRTLEFYRAFFPGNSAPAWVSREIGACITYTGARRLDEAGQFPQAIQGYQDTLRAAGRLVPVKLIATRLAELLKTQPAAFVEAARIPQAAIYYAPTAMPDRTNFNPPSSPSASSYLVPRAERPMQ
jgi:tetratricopeptide (TPR) repeat protein